MTTCMWWYFYKCISLSRPDTLGYYKKNPKNEVNGICCFKPTHVINGFFVFSSSRLLLQWGLSIASGLFMLLLFMLLVLYFSTDVSVGSTASAVCLCVQWPGDRQVSIGFSELHLLLIPERGYPQQTHLAAQLCDVNLCLPALEWRGFRETTDWFFSFLI